MLNAFLFWLGFVFVLVRGQHLQIYLDVQEQISVCLPEKCFHCVDINDHD